MRYAALKENDIVNGEGVVVSLFMQGCPHHCHGCFNQETWDPQGGKEVDINKLIEKIENAISANGVIRNFSILGGEPFAPYNVRYTYYIVSQIREKYPNIKIYIWTGYYFDDIKDNKWVRNIIQDIDYIIDGPFEEDKKDITLKLRGSSNQHIIDIKEKI